MAYTTIDDPSAYFQTITWTGNGSDPRTITFDGNSDMQPDWVWEKSRSLAYQHNIYDSVRGGGKGVVTNTTAAEVSNNANGYISAFTSDGFTLTAGSTNNEQLNENTTTYVGWGWKAGTSFTNDASGTGIGSIDSAGSVNTDAGFSIVSWTGTGSAGTIKHGLSTAPSMIIIKNRSSAYDWTVGHNSLGWTNVVFLNLDTASQGDTQFNNTAPTSSVFSIGTPLMANKSGDSIIAYCFSEKKGYSKFSSYIGNGSTDGTFVYTGFKPAFLIVKKTDSVNSWVMFDNKRSSSGGSNEIDYSLTANEADAEETGTTSSDVDFCSNGVKIREDNGGVNASGGSYIYMAFAENPFVTSTGVPATAR